MGHSKKILVVDDDPFFAMDLEDGFRTAGFEVMGPASDVKTALKLLEGEKPDMASLDYNLDGETSSIIAEQLCAMGVNFVYVTGRTSEFLTSEGAPKALVISKPATPNNILEILAS